MGDKQISLKALRVENGYSQEALAQKLGVNPRTVSGWENKRVPVKPIHVYALSYLYNIDSDIVRI